MYKSYLIARHFHKRNAALICTLWLLGLLFLDACGNLKKPSEAASLSQAWRLNVAPSSQQFESIYPIIAGDDVLCSAYQERNLVFFCCGLKDGALRWRFSDTTLHDAPYYNLKAISLQNQFVLPLGNTILTLRKKDGKPVWCLDIKNNAEQFLEQVGQNSFLQARNDWTTRSSSVLRINVESGKVDTLFQRAWPDSCKLLIRTPAVLPNGNLIYSSIALNTVTRSTKAFWYLLDGRDFKLLKSGMAYPDNAEGLGVTKQPIVVGDKAILCASDQLFCLDGQGQEQWRVKMPRDMLSSVPLFYQDALFCAMEDGFLYKINVSTGVTQWKSKASGTPSRMEVFGPQIFLVGGGDGLLYTFDIQDGRMIRKMESPNNPYRKNAHFRRFIGLDAAKGLLLLYDGNDLRAFNLLDRDK